MTSATHNARDLDKLISQVAAQQHWVVSRRQLLDLGAGEKAIRHRLESRRLMRVHAGVYVIRPGSLGRDGSFMAAVLACGDSAVLSHRSAAALWDLRPTPAGAIDVTTRRGTRRRRGIAIHTSRDLEPEAVTTCRQIPCTTVARTLLDLAGVFSERTLARAIEQAMVLRLFDHSALSVLLTRSPARRGAATLRRLMQDLTDEPALTRNELERRFLEIVRNANLPMPVVNVRVEGYEVDFHWSEHRLIVEADGRAVHETAVAFERDRARDLDLELAGWHVLRLGWRQITDHPDRVVTLLRRRLRTDPR
jgi:very-short-patch-repair endonuclease